MKLLSRDDVARKLTYEVCIPAIRTAMIALAKGETRQLPRGVLPLAEGELFGSMVGALGGNEPFGAKLISIFHGNFDKGVPSHQGVVVLFDRETGRPIAVADGGEITAIRTACASAVATDVLARPDASHLALLGYGEQSETHLQAISRVRKLTAVSVWGRSPERAQAFADKMGATTGLSVTAAPTARDAVAEADIICTLTNARDPILLGDWVRPGTHVNAVGSSVPGPVEIDHDLVVKSRFVADSRVNVMLAGAEFLKARETGLIGDDHIVAEIGQVLAGDIVGRRNDEDITLYKSLGHIVQDLASLAAILAADISDERVSPIA
jgi:ornithine cyclodeaminase/alanine dehydrogenase-like protein (mu-crystallin family)